MLRAIRERRLLLSMVLMVALVLVLAILSFSVLYQRSLGNLLTMKILRQNESMLEINTQAVDDVLGQCTRATVAIQNDRHFTLEYVLNNPTAFIDICNTLTDYVSFIPHVEDIFFINRGYRGIFTMGGMYNPLFFDVQQSSLHARAATWVYEQHIRYGTRSYFTTELLNNQIFTNRNEVVEYVVPIQYGQGLVGFRILAQAFLPQDANIELILADRDSGLLYCSSADRTREDAQQLLASALSASESAGVLNVDGRRSYYLLQSATAAPLQMLYLIPYDLYMAEIRSANRLFFIVCSVIFALCGGLAAILVPLAYAPVRRMRRLITGAPVDIPRGLNEAESAHYALQALGSRYDELRSQHRAVQHAQLIRRIIHHDAKGEDFLQECAEADLRVQGRHLVFWMLSATVEDEALAGQLLTDAEFMLSRRYDVAWTDYASRLTFVLLVLSDEPVDRNFLEDVARHLGAKHPDRFALGISQSMNDYKHAHRAFQEARTAMRSCLQHPALSHCFYDALSETVEEAPYPKTEIDGLQYAIAHQSPEQVEMLVDVLIRIVREQSRSSLSYCLCYDIANTMLHVARQNELLAAQLAANPRYFYDAVEFSDLTDFVDFVQQLTRLILEQIARRSNLYAETLAYIEEKLLDMDLFAD
ncbi:MAG TPA: hypothetical protein PKE04_09320, partial [Clostridia bacterium]|nr:hypothetical protein [Clostridia bacterium]